MSYQNSLADVLTGPLTITLKTGDLERAGTSPE
jgi:hypothetical protein